MQPRGRERLIPPAQRGTLMFREDMSALAGQAHGQKLRAKFVDPTGRLFSPPPGASLPLSCSTGHQPSLSAGEAGFLCCHSSTQFDVVINA